MIFISYAREDGERVGQLIDAITKHLWLRVWSDRQIKIGTSFTTAIDTALTASWVVVVISTQHSVTSDFVREEARRALKEGCRLDRVLRGGGPADLCPRRAFVDNTSER